MPVLKNRLCLSALFLFTIVIFASPAFSDEHKDKALDQKPIKVNFDDIVDPEGTKAKNGNPSKLRIAVAAMISPKYTYTYYVELLNLIGEFMNSEVIFVQKKTYAEVNDMIKNRELDLAFVCSGPYVSGKKEFGMEIIAVPVCHGQKVYYSYFIASHKSGITSFDELKGKTFAFTDPLSNTGFLVPSYYLARQNETPEHYFRKTFFTHSHDNSIQAVAEGLADGAAVDSLIFDFMQNTHPELTRETIIIKKSDPYGIPPVVVHPQMDREQKEKLRKIFLSIHEYPQGKSILKNLQIDRFSEGNDADYNTVRDLKNFLNTRQPSMKQR